MSGDRVAFLFLGETLLIPHLWPIVEALAADAPDLAIDCWVATGVHEALVTRWSAHLPAVRVRRAPGFRPVADAEEGRNPPLPPKLPTLARLAPHLLRTRVVVCAEQTSLWLPTLLPLPTRFIDTFHGAGSMRARGHWRRRSGWRTLVPSAAERQALIDAGDRPARVHATGYVKSAFRWRTPAQRWFADERPSVLYAPHWQQHRSSWWAWGREVVAMLCAQDRFNVILAPHQRLVERAPEVRDVLAEAVRLPHVHADLDSFACVDGSYTAAADIYLGDTSSQVVEFLARPRPCVFLNYAGLAWRDDPSFEQWQAGEVVERLDAVLPALDVARARHPERAGWQRAFAVAQLGVTDGSGARVAAGHVLAALGRERPAS